MNKLLEYDVFIFDFDGTIMNTETYHCLAWSNALSEYKNENIKISLLEYQENFHKLDKNYSKNFLEINYKEQLEEEINYFIQEKYGDSRKKLVHGKGTK